MNRASPRNAELVLPAVMLPALRRALAEEVGADLAARTLARAGEALGERFHAHLAEPAGLPSAEYFRRLTELFAARGWGRLVHRASHPGVGSLASGNWAEADPGSAEPRPSCALTAGALGALLGRVTGAPVAVLESECRTRGDSTCRFLFGSPETLRRVEASLSAGSSTDAALADLR